MDSHCHDLSDDKPPRKILIGTFKTSSMPMRPTSAIWCGCLPGGRCGLRCSAYLYEMYPLADVRGSDGGPKYEGYPSRDREGAGRERRADRLLQRVSI